MVAMYIANVHHQTQDFAYRLPENPKLFRQEIKVGEQIRVAANLTTTDVESIIGQYACYGMIPAADVQRREEHTSLVYSIDKPVSPAQMREAWERNCSVLENRGRELRADAAVAVNNALKEESDKFRAIEMSVVEQRTDGGLPTVNDRVVVDARKPDTTGRNTRRRRVA